MSLAVLWYSVNILEPISHGYWRVIPPYFREMIESFALPYVHVLLPFSQSKGNSLWVNKFLLLSSNSSYNFLAFQVLEHAAQLKIFEKGPVEMILHSGMRELCKKQSQGDILSLFNTVNSEFPGMSSSATLKCTYINFIKFSIVTKNGIRIL